jgi:predicted AAA+ superfamily ATPase
MDEYFNALEKYNFWESNPTNLGFPRKSYTQKIHAYSGNRLIKVLVGQRRAGKSYLLRQLILALIESGVSSKNIFFLNREMADFDFIKNFKDLDALFKQYKEKIKPSGRIYLFIDEIQNIEGWEKLVNSYSQDYTSEYELYISGSNSKMLSGELATLLSGRYVSFEIFPLSYTEFLGISAQAKGKESYLNFLQTGGLPELFQLMQEDVKRNYVSALKDTVLLRDIIQRHAIKDMNLLEDIFVYLVNNASNLISIKNIVNYFKSNNRKTSYDTVAAYIGYIEDAYLIHKTERYNIKGKETVAGVAKYYINDLSFYNYLYRGFGYGFGYLLENLLYLELRKADYQVYVGTIKGTEVDFVATRGERKIYVQSSYLLLDKNTIEREYASLELIKDNYEKIVVSIDDINLPSKDGVKHVLAWNFAEYIQ